MRDFTELCTTKDLNEGDIKPFDVGDKRVMLVKHNGRIFALDRICTHANADLSEGFLSGNNIVCPLHASAFGLADGRVINPPANKALRTYDVKLENGRVFVRL